MKKISVIAIIFLLLLTTCTKINQTGIVVKNCTGTYVRLNGVDYKVCNPTSLDGFENDVKMEINYKMKEDCNFDGNVCMMYYPYEGNIEISDVSLH